MYKKRSVLGLIPARGGSKGLPRKNIRLLGGKPLMAHSILQGHACGFIDRVIVSTEDAEIASIAKQYGAEVPFLRPVELAQDRTTDYPVCVHALKWLKESESFEPDLLFLLRPTGPLRTTQQMTDAMELLLKYRKADSVRSVNEPPQTPYKMWRPGRRFMKPLLSHPRVSEPYSSPRQVLPKVYQTNPNIHLVWRRTIERERSILGSNVLPLVIEGPLVDVDGEFDLVVAEVLMKKTGNLSSGLEK